MLETLARKYRRETGLEPTFKRLQMAMMFCRKNGYDPKDVQFQSHIDPLWNKRLKRSPTEKMAVAVGYTNAQQAGGPASRWWVVPKRLPKAA